MVEDNAGVTTDNIGAEILEAQKEQLHKEIELFEKNLEQLKKDKENFVTQWAVDNKLYEIILKDDNMKKINPEFGYELNPEYWELRHKQQEFRYRMDKHLAESKIRGYDVQMQAAEEQLVSANQKLNELGE